MATTRKYPTAPSFHTKQDCIAECECGWRSEARNAMGLAALHHAACGKRTRCEVIRAWIWKDASEA